ncbi:hypothetical protein CEXT_588181 [Caerostris extrusa]|uniref:Uncharacterized protein n=1 Tax=Caerostris extrusa TaxID=172846 RepID=A0AAV4WLQ7_CAEEX|nr:hypothetical protein CEXT_588181 [Caerostris extrusa]
MFTISDPDLCPWRLNISTGIVISKSSYTPIFRFIPLSLNSIAESLLDFCDMSHPEKCSSIRPFSVPRFGHRLPKEFEMP